PVPRGRVLSWTAQSGADPAATAAPGRRPRPASVAEATRCGLWDGRAGGCAARHVSIVPRGSDAGWRFEPGRTDTLLRTNRSAARPRVEPLPAVLRAVSADPHVAELAQIDLAGTRPRLLSPASAATPPPGVGPRYDPAVALVGDALFLAGCVGRMRRGA